jgi:hypothetical protein
METSEEFKRNLKASPPDHLRMRFWARFLLVLSKAAVHCEIWLCALDFSDASFLLDELVA